MTKSEEFESLRALMRKLQDRRDAVRNALDDIMAQLRAVSTTIELLRKERTPRRNAARKILHIAGESEILAELRTKKTQVPALIAIAKRNGGILLTRDAKYLLQRADLMKSTKNASSILYNVIARSERFEHIGPGKYQLKPLSAKFPSSGAFQPPLAPTTANALLKPIQ